MRRIVTWAMSTLTVLVLLFSYNTSRSSQPVATADTRRLAGTSQQANGPAAGVSPGQQPQPAQAPGGAPAGSSSKPSAPSSPSGSTAPKTVAGDPVMTPYGPVQVQITLQNGRITSADALQAPSGSGRDQMINSQAVPVYNEEAVTAQSATIDVVSGATYTYDGYVQSLQSAIDRSHQ